MSLVPATFFSFSPCPRVPERVPVSHPHPSTGNGIFCPHNRENKVRDKATAKVQQKGRRGRLEKLSKWAGKQLSMTEGGGQMRSIVTEGRGFKQESDKTDGRRE